MKLFKKAFQFNANQNQEYRKFGEFLALFLGVLSFWRPGYGLYFQVNYLFLGISVLLLSFVFPQLFFIPLYFWKKLSIFLQYVLSPIVLATVYYLLLSPLAYFLRWMKWDPLNKQFPQNVNSYWQKISETRDYRTYFDKQY